jgi:hypothetical protein
MMTGQTRTAGPKEDVMSKIRTCECGEILGEACQWDGRGGPRVRIEYVPDSLQGTAQAAGTARGMWESILVEQSCAELLLGPDEETGEVNSWIRRAPRAALRRREVRAEMDREALASISSVLR